jgi:hypothetical protein
MKLGLERRAVVPGETDHEAALLGRARPEAVIGELQALHLDLRPLREGEVGGAGLVEAVLRPADVDLQGILDERLAVIGRGEEERGRGGARISHRRHVHAIGSARCDVDRLAEELW